MADSKSLDPLVNPPNKSNLNPPAPVAPVKLEQVKSPPVKSEADLAKEAKESRDRVETKEGVTLPGVNLGLPGPNTGGSSSI